MFLKNKNNYKNKHKHIKKYLTIKQVKTDKKLLLFFEKTKIELDRFFGFRANEPLLFLLDSREDLDIIWGRKTEPWLVGAFKNNSIYILNPLVYEKFSSHKKEEFFQNFKHEYCHSYYTQITKSIYPIWLNEGLASYVSGKKLILTSEKKRNLLNIFNYFDKSDKDVYAVGQFWVEYLLKKHGKKKFLDLIKGFNSESNIKGLDAEEFSREFYNIYGFKFNKRNFSKFI